MKMFDLLGDNTLFAHRFISTPLLPDFERKASKKHKGLGKTQYSKRIQKKWNKRFGFTEERYILVDKESGVIYMSPANVEWFKENLEMGR